MSDLHETIQTQAEEIPQHPFEKGLALYEQKASLDVVIPLFEQGILLSPKDSTGYTCLAWLHLLRQENDDITRAINYARQAMKAEPGNHQAHFNLVLAMLVGGVKGVRAEFLAAMRKCQQADDYQEVIANLHDALERRPDFAEAAKLLKWIQE
jgi:tetratricopeptide (TPR) repeat protein